MFVIVQCWYNLQEEETFGKTLHEKIGLTMKHAGVAITVTSFTDVFAFGMGAITVSIKNFLFHKLFYVVVEKKMSISRK